MHRAVIATAAATVLAVGLTACRGPEPREPDPGPAPTATSATPSPTAKAPTMPAQARKNTPEGAVAFVNYWVQTFNHAARTGDVTALESLSSSCEPCDGYVRSFENLKQSDRPRTDPWVISRVAVSPDRNPLEVFAKVRVLEDQAKFEAFSLTFTLSSHTPFQVRDIVRSAR